MRTWTITLGALLLSGCAANHQPAGLATEPVLPESLQYAISGTVQEIGLA